MPFRSCIGRYRNTTGNLSLGNGALTFTRTDGLISKAQRIVVSIPVEAIREVNIEGVIGKKLILLVDPMRVPGIPRHEFGVDDPLGWRQAIMAEISERNQVNQSSFQQIQTNTIIKETVREIVKIPCQYCGSLVEITWQNCSSCGAPLAKK